MIPAEYIRLYARIGGIFIVFLLAVIGLFSIDRCNRKKDLLPETIVQVDTIYIRDTIRIATPIPQIIRNTDTFRIAITDTIRVKDTVYLNLPREQKIYQEEDFHAWISGYRPVLDSIHIFRNTHQVITSTTIHQKPNKPQRWGIAIQAGYGIIFHQNTIKPAPYIGIGLSYHLLTF